MSETTVSAFHDEYVSIPQAAALLGVSRSTMWRIVNRLEVPAKRYGANVILISTYELRKFKENAVYEPASKELGMCGIHYQVPG